MNRAGEGAVEKKLLFGARRRPAGSDEKTSCSLNSCLSGKNAASVAEAAQLANISRGVFYKYRDAIFPFQAVTKENIVTLFFHLEDRSGTLSQLLGVVAAAGCNVLTIHQTIPLQGRANVTLSVSTNDMNEEIDELLAKLKQLEFVEKVEIVGSGVY